MYKKAAQNDKNAHGEYGGIHTRRDYVVRDGRAFYPSLPHSASRVQAPVETELVQRQQQHWQQQHTIVQQRWGQLPG